LLATADLLRRDGFEVESAQNSASATELLRHGTFDVLILDINMAGNVDLELVTALADAGLNVPVILVTGYPTLSAAAEAVGLSVLACLTKPFDYALLTQHVRAGVRLSRIL
jgi:DNA-binding NtrC family response regulator